MNGSKRQFLGLPQARREMVESQISMKKWWQLSPGSHIPEVTHNLVINLLLKNPALQPKVHIISAGFISLSNDDFPLAFFVSRPLITVLIPDRSLFSSLLSTQIVWFLIIQLRLYGFLLVNIPASISNTLCFSFSISPIC